MNGVKYVLYNIASFARWLAENLGPGARTGRTATGNREPLTLQKKKKNELLAKPKMVSNWSFDRSWLSSHDHACC